MTDPSRPHIYEHPGSLGSFRSWLRLLGQSEGLDRQFWLRVLFVSASTLLTSPLRLYERLRYDRRLGEVAVHPAPIFIVGHWRTGTTHLHNLLCQDPELAWVTTFQGLAPGFCLSGDRLLKPALQAISRRLHPTRLIDEIPLVFDDPQEDDFAVANLSPFSFLHLFTFPRQAAHFFERYALLEGLSEAELAEWRQVYLAVLRKASYRAGGKRLALKSPVNSGRIGALLELFPQAKFIHIARNPYDVFLSNRKLYHTVLPRAQVQQVSPQQIDALILGFYRRLLQKYLADKALIPPGSLVEVRYEELEAAPLEQLRRVYEQLELPGFARAEPAVRAYLGSIAGYRKNRHALSGEVIASVNQHWGFAFDTWDYPRLP